MTAYTFPQLIDFTRTSAATFVNSSGNIASTPQSRNLLTFTQDFYNPVWTRSGAVVTANQNPATAAPGVDFVTNGTFNAGTTGWVAINSTQAVVSGQLEVTQTGVNARSEQSIPTIVGRTYLVTAQARVGTAASVTIIANEGTGAFRNLASQTVTSGTLTPVSFYFTALASSTLIQLFVPNVAGVTGYFDNISVRELDGGYITAPDGTPTADKLIEDTTFAEHKAERAITVAAGAVTLSVYAKAAERGFLAIRENINGSFVNTFFNLTTGVVVSTGASRTSAITSVGNGWYRCAVTGISAGSSVSCGFDISSDGTNVTYTGDGTSGIFLWGAQLEQVPDANLTLGSELLSAGAIQLIGTATAATYNTSTGVGSATRVDGANQSSVGWTGLNNSASYRIDIENTGANSISMRSGTATGSIPVTVLAGQRVTIYIAPTGGAITITSGFGTANFTVYSFREITAITGMPTDYTRNFGGLFPPRFDYDPVTRAPRGLLIEEQRTNLLRRSEEFDNASWNNATPNVPTVTQNTTVAPDGTTTADTLTAATGGTSSQTRQNSGATGTTGNFTGSVYLKAGTSSRTRILIADATTVFTAVGDFSITWSAGVATIHSTTSGTASITDAGGGWYRCVLTANVPSANASVSFSIYPDSLSGTGSVIAWGAQLEAGAFATSYIPTVASQVTRTADGAVIQAPNFASWYNQSEGTFVIDADTVAPSSLLVRQSVVAGDGTASNFIRAYTYDGRWASAVTTGGVSQADLYVSGNTAVVNVPAKYAIAFKANDFAGCLNGGTVTTDTSGTVPTVNQLSLGQYGVAGNGLNGHLRSVRYYPTRLTNAQLQALTA